MLRPLNRRRPSLGVPVLRRRGDIDHRREPRALARLRNCVFSLEHGDFASRPPVMAHRGSWVVEAAVGRRLIGYCWATPAAGGNGRVCVIDEVGVLEEHRRVGIATALVRETAAWMVELGFDTTWITPLRAG